MPYVALDLETTGLDPDNDEIIEVAAIRFDADRVIDTYQTFVNPGRKLQYRIALLTGIDPAALESAPHFGSIAVEVEDFIGLDPIVGQNPTFDTTFLQRKGVQVFGPTYDTFELAGLLLPGLQQHSLGAIAEHLGIESSVWHRAMPDADAARRVFLALRHRLLESPPVVLAEADRLAAMSDWPLRHLLREVAALRPRAPGDSGRDGFVHEFVRAPGEIPAPLRSNERQVPADPKEAVRVISSPAMREALEAYEERPEQTAMARIVAETVGRGERLIVEAGTGVGKSLAYLVPAALQAARNNERVVVSTNTINLQEQLIAQDIPVARRLLREAGVGEDDLRVAQLKGRRNYLCLLRWAAARRNASLTPEEARVLVRTLFWLGETETGDRAEINLRREEDAAWWRLSAQDSGCLATQCAYVRDGSCFLHRARRRAEAAHLLVVNHALLLSDVAAGGNVLPDYQHLVVDEAHHLEDEATQQLGFSASEQDVMSWLERVHVRGGRERASGVAASVIEATRASQQAAAPAPQLQTMARTVAKLTAAAREAVPPFFRALRDFGAQHSSGRGDYDERLLLSRGIRVQPDWADIEAAWYATEEALAAVCGALDELQAMLSQAQPDALLDRDAIVGEAAAVREDGERLRAGISQIINRDDRDRVCWMTTLRRDAAPTLASAPLSVAETLRTALFDPKQSVVLTSATLSADDSFDYVKGRLGYEDARELLLGSPFDYKTSTLILAPSDMPEPDNHGYLAAVRESIVEMVTASEGRALVLFTSHAGLRAAYDGIKAPLEERQILVLGQGIDGPPRQLLGVLRENFRTVVLGAASFWEGVDVTGEALSLLVMARLPFSVPTDPVFQARSELFESPFEQYALPQAILRFKQGFGRLIRSKHDRGAVVLLDRRLDSKYYGRVFL
ncbi:MAG TPA: helicase C-terminal domain-containing protein, partial [Dehalococcoidia bacterium]|nr:helicase C-terminal domain-containing protein [Dehalococcoidia bacterium]